jgi:GIY-YIG catalytic domain
MTSGLGDVPRGSHVTGVGTLRQDSLRPAQVPGDELAQQLRAMPLANHDAEVFPVRIGNADDAVRGVGALRSADHALRVRAAYATCPASRLTMHMHNGKVLHMHIEEMPESLHASLTATLQHIRLIQEKEARLANARQEALAQALHRIGSDYRTGRLTPEQLFAAFTEIHALEMSGRMHMWNEIVGISWQRLTQLGKQLPNGPEGSWVGEYPIPADAPRPIYGISVVYVLFDEANEPCYVGSTNKLSARLNAHKKDGKRFVRWQAHHCGDRDHAYRLEDRLLRQHMPYLNRKASR